MNLILFVKYKKKMKLVPATHSKKVGKHACLALGNNTVYFYYTL